MYKKFLFFLSLKKRTDEVVDRRIILLNKSNKIYIFYFLTFFVLHRIKLFNKYLFLKYF